MSHGHTTQRPLLSILPFNNSDNKQQSQSPPTKRHCVGASRRAARLEQRVSSGSATAAPAHRGCAEASMKRSRVICCGSGSPNNPELVYAGGKPPSQRAASNCHLDSAMAMPTVPGVLAQSASDFCLQSHGMARGAHVVVDENRGAHNRNSDTNSLPVPSAVFSRHDKDSSKRHDHHLHHNDSDPPQVRSGSMVGAGAILSGPGGLPRGTTHSHQLTGAGSSHNNGPSHLSDRYASGGGSTGVGGTTAAGSAAAAPGTMHTSASDKMISKKDKARQKFSHNLLKRAKVLISDRDSKSTQPYKVSATTPLNPDKFKVLKLKAAIDKKPTTIDERSTAVLKYRTPHFRAVACVEVPPLRENQGVLIGWIQVCTEMRFINSYGKYGVTSWEFPEIISGKYTMIGDADGKQYPWYGSKLELQPVYGPTTAPACATVHMNDNFFPQVTWYIPHPDYDKSSRLTHIHRKQKFYTFLVAYDVHAKMYHVLKTIEWRMELNVSVNASAPLGKRATLCEPFEQIQPRVLEANSIKLEEYALRPPNANNAQTLIWRPVGAEPRMIVPPVETSIDMDRYLAVTRHLDSELQRYLANSASSSGAYGHHSEQQASGGGPATNGYSNNNNRRQRSPLDDEHQSAMDERKTQKASRRRGKDDCGSRLRSQSQMQ